MALQVVLVLLLVLGAAHSSVPVYLLLTPRVVRPGSPVCVSVSVLGSDPEVEVLASVVQGNRSVSRGRLVLPAGSTELLVLPPVEPTSDPAPFVLEVEGHVGNRLLFSNSTTLTFDPAAAALIIQTDRARYRPGQEVKVRVVSLRPDGKPHPGPVELSVSDPRGNLLRRWPSVGVALGVASQRFTLSDRPPLGRWSVRAAAAAGAVQTKHFHVEHYVLPRFQVVLDVPSEFFHLDALRGTVSARFWYGRPVDGHMFLSVHHHVHGFVETYHIYRQLNGSSDFSLKLQELQWVDDVFESEFKSWEELVMLQVNVTERSSGRTQGSSARVSVSKHRYRLDFQGFPQRLRPSLSISAQLQVTVLDGRPLTAREREDQVEVTVAEQRRGVLDLLRDQNLLGPRGRAPEHPAPAPDHVSIRTLALPVPEDGSVPLLLLVSNDTVSLTVDVSFGDSYNFLHLSRSYTSDSSSYLQIHAPATPAQVGSVLVLQVQRSFPAEEVLHYVVKSRGQVVSGGRSLGDITLVPEASWSPRALVLVYCVRPHGEMVNDLLPLRVEPALRNQVSVSWSAAAVEPGGAATLRVRAQEPHSLVWVLVVDRAARQAHTDDITTHKVVSELLRLGDSSLDPRYDMLPPTDPLSVFQAADFLVLSDVDLPPTENYNLLPTLPGEGPDFSVTEASTNQEARERSYFPETWEWRVLNLSGSVSADLDLTAPDSITSWAACAFVMSENLGIGVAEPTPQLSVLLDFFLTLNLPVSVVRGEELLLEVVLFNYLDQDLEVVVWVAPSASFSFVFPDLSVAPVPPGVRRRLVLPGRTGSSVLVPVRPLLLGPMDVSVSAQAPGAADRVRRTVLVKPEGIQHTYSAALLLEAPPPGPAHHLPEAPPPGPAPHLLSFTFPPAVVQGSQRVELTAVGDLLGPSLSGLDALILLPSGCGEQNMINLAPNIYVLQYLEATGRGHAPLWESAKGHMTTGYENQLRFLRPDGSFSAFGADDSSGSTWLSAFVLRCLLQARRFMSVDPGVLSGAAAWMLAQQEPDGSFLEPGRVIHTQLQGGVGGGAGGGGAGGGGAGGGVALTAYVVVALLEDDVMRAQFSAQVSAALLFLETRQALGVSSSYSLSLLTYALCLSGSATAPRAVEQLLGRAHLRDGEPSWSAPEGGGVLSRSWQPRTSDMETSAYLLLALYHLGRPQDGVGLMRWLSRQRNSRGGFGSTQDTVVALQALALYAALGGSAHVDLTLTVVDQAPPTGPQAPPTGPQAPPTGPQAPPTEHIFHIHQGNYMVLQKQQVRPQEELLLHATAQGHGLALLQLNVLYNVWPEEEPLRRRRRDLEEAFDLDVRLHDLDDITVHFYICTRLRPSSNLSSTGMVLLQVAPLSGFVLSPEGVATDEEVKKVEETGGGEVVLYLDSVTVWSEVCVLVPTVLTQQVAQVQDASVSVFDYYEPRRRAHRTVSSPRRKFASSCSFCGAGCRKCRAPQPQPQPVSRSRSRFLPNSALLLLLLLLLL